MKLQLILCLGMMLLTGTMYGQFVHPGCLHKKSDLDRMKYMVEAEIEPYISTFNKLKTHSQASYSYAVKGDTSMTEGTDNLISSDGCAAYLNALMWYITGDERHAQKCVEIFNAWVNVKKTNGFALRSGTSSHKLIEGAEIIKSTYSGWKEEDIDKFKAMLVYPGYSNTTIPSGDKSFYWNILNGDPGRHGNQDAIAFRSMISMGVFLDNEIMYDRALNYYKGLPHRADDIPYASGPGVSGTVKSDNPYFTNYANSNPGTITDYGFNGVLEHYFWENGQCQESSRDQAHTFFGLGIFEMWAEVAWNQGDDAWNYLDNRLLKAFEYNLKYNLSYVQSYPDQPTPWEPTVENGQFIQRTDRTGRWKSKSINPHYEGDFVKISRGQFLGTRPIFEQAMAHFDVRMGFSEEQTLWTSRGRELYGIEENGWTVDHSGWGSLTFHRPEGCAGDPISGFDSGAPVFEMNHIGAVIEAENYDQFADVGQGRTYFDQTETNSGGKYRTEDYVDISTCSEGGYMLSELEDGEWLTYTVYVPEFSIYDVNIRYAAASEGGKIKVSFAGEDKTEAMTIPFGGENSNGLTDWKDLKIANEIFLDKGVQQMKISISGASNAFVINNITISESTTIGCDDAMPAVELPSRAVSGNYYNYYEGSWDSLPNFNELTPTSGDFISDTIQIVNIEKAEQYGLVFNGYFKVELDGNYVFFLNSADGSKLYIDGKELINNDGLHSAIEVSNDTCLQAGYHLFRVEYFNKTANDILSVMYSGPGVPKQVLNNTYGVGPCENEAVTPSEDLIPGIQYAYYEGEWTSLPGFPRLALSEDGITSTINLDSARQADHYAFAFDGYIKITTDGDYTFFTASDDGSRLLIDGREILDNDGTHGVEEAAGSTCLAPGYHQIRVEYFEGTGDDDSLSVWYDGPDFDKKELTEFYTTPLTQKADQEITFDEFPVYTINDSFIFLRAKSSARVSASYTSSNESVATISGKMAYIKGVGTTTITALFAATTDYNEAAVSQVLTVIEDNTAVNEVLQQGVLIYPNPATDQLTIQLPHNAETQLSISDYLGKEVHLVKFNASEHKVDLSGLKKGFYIARLLINGASLEYKIAIQ